MTNDLEKYQKMEELHQYRGHVPKSLQDHQLKAIRFYCEYSVHMMCPHTKTTLESAVKEDFEEEDDAACKTAQAIVGCKDEGIIFISCYCLDIAKYAIDTTLSRL